MSYTLISRFSFFGTRLPQHGLLRVLWIHCPEALLARGNPMLGQRLLAIRTESHHQIDGTDLALHNDFWAQTMWEVAEHLLT
jgi:hypothetical protein